MRIKAVVVGIAVLGLSQASAAMAVGEPEFGCGHVHTATRETHGGQPLVRHAADLVVPVETAQEIAVLKGIAAHYVMRTPERAQIMDRQRELLAELFDALASSDGRELDAMFRDDHERATDDAGRTRVVVDQIASLTDGSAVSWHARLTGRVRP